MDTIQLFANNNVLVVYHLEGDKPFIKWIDKRDKYNDFTGFTRNKRGLKKASAFIEHLATVEDLKDNITMGDITRIMEKFSLKPHTYCAMD
jgi:hypothetical protein